MVKADRATEPSAMEAEEPYEETLDPSEWSDTLATAHRIVDDAVDHLRSVRDRPVWQEMPLPVRQFFDSPVPREPTALSTVYRDVTDTVMRYPLGNIHPRFLAWFMGSSNFTGALADFLAAIQGSNLGGFDHAAALMDQQVIEWFKELMGFPASATGTLVSGGSVANLIGLTVARNAKAGVDVRELGVAAIEKPLRFYASDQVHSCHQKAMEELGLGNQALRRIPCDAGLRIDIIALREAIRIDRGNGRQPACIIGSAGTINTGSIDDLQALADVAKEEGLWFHVDGCIGGLIAIAPRHRRMVAGLERADSIAFDPHKWLHAPFEAGCALVRDGAAHRAAFSTHAEYLEPSRRGVAAAEWLYDYGLQISRGFKALKIWMAIKEHGIEKFGRLIDQNIAQAHYLGSLIEADPRLELVAPPTINIVCFRYRPSKSEFETLKALNTEIMLRLQETGIAVVSDTTVQGEHCLRVAITNHRTRREDLDLLVREIIRLGSRLHSA